MSESAGKRSKRYEYHLNDRSKITCIIYGPGHSSDEYKVLGDFGSNYAKIRPNKDHRHDPATNKNFGRHQDNNDIVQHAVNEIILQKKKITVKDETHKNIDDEVYEDNLYSLDKMSLDEK